MENIINAVAYLAMLSIATERFVEILKKLSIQKYIKNDGVYQLLATLFGSGLCLISPPNLNFVLMDKYLIIIIVGLAVSGGSGFWHDLLKVLSEYSKTLKQTDTSEITK